MSAEAPAGPATGRASSVLLTLAAGQFLMTLDMSVMTVAIRNARRPRPTQRCNSPESGPASGATLPGRTAMCLFLILLLFGPRSVIVIWWLLQPLRWDAAFGSFIVPFLGFLILPWTTLMYVIVAPGGLVGLDVLWMALAVLADIASYTGGGVYGRRRRISTA
jgi:hypothetical protein